MITVSLIRVKANFCFVYRLNALFFVLSGLDSLDGLDEISKERKQELVDWIYSQQLIARKPEQSDAVYGFRGSPSNGEQSDYDCGNLPMTYCALASLVILGDDLKRVCKEGILKCLKMYELPDGSFIACQIEKENDLRSVYCAAAISELLKDFSSIDIVKTTDYIKSCLTYENGFGQKPGMEAHGGPTFCAIAAMHMMNTLEWAFEIEELEDIANWCLQRHVSGFQGRPYKDPDTCYSYWIGASIYLLNQYDLVDHKEEMQFLETTQDYRTGGFGKHPDSYPGKCVELQK